MRACIAGAPSRKGDGSTLVVYAERRPCASRILKGHKMTEPQRMWLERICTQVKRETVVDVQSLDRGQFKEDGALPG